MFGLVRKTESPKTRFLICQSGSDFEIVGESHYQTALERLAGGKKPDGVEVDTGALLIPEPENPYDENAVK
ncbi:hypothetical protein [Falsiphaeobacter marinintestinus]|uniref:hypothetical protein n=1 Tax=Falsiphaeobacter marinintestinus TaxID=1492905 RepID=UPI0016461DF8|nr:hypothetical protein [Phaeobacter marinintestinus]